MRRVATLLTITGLTVLVGACSAPPPPAAPPDCRGTGVTEHRDLRYAASPGTDPAMQSLDLYLPVRPPGCGPAPLVAYVHGGGFQNGNKTNKVDDKVALFTAEGWAFSSIEYRLVNDPRSGPTNGVYPAQPQDIGTALGFLADHAADYGLDPERIVTMGHSAGAFLVALVSTDEQFVEASGLEMSDIACTVPLDTGGFDITATVADGGAQAAMYRAAFGDDPTVWVQASPIENLDAGKGIPDFLLFVQGSAKRKAGTTDAGTPTRSLTSR
jgi:acetyl esterase/lipase